VNLDASETAIWHRRRSRPERGSAIWLGGIVATALALIIVGVYLLAAHLGGPLTVGSFVTKYDHVTVHNPIERLIVNGDGQAFAALAEDPLLRRPDQFPTKEEAVYRAQRPLIGYLAWALSLGQPQALPASFLVLSLAGAALAGSGCARLLGDGRGHPALCGLVVLLPGSLLSLQYLGPELLALGLVAHGLADWDDSRGHRRPLLLLCAAALARETTMLVPLALLLTSSRGQWRRSLALTVPAGSYLAWMVLLRWRWGVWPAKDGALGLPLAGIWEGVVRYGGGDSLGLICNLAFLVFAVVAGLRHLGRDRLAVVVLLHVALATVLGAQVWAHWQHAARVLLPGYALALIVAMRPVGPGGAHRKSRLASTGWTGRGSNLSATTLTTPSARSRRPRTSRAGALRTMRR
jgi:hypothetical protein